MNKKQVAILFVLTLLPFIAYGFRSDLIGTDGYLYLATVCHKADYAGQNNVLLQDNIQKSLFSLIPCNLIAIKAILFSLCFVSVWFIAKTGEVFDQKNGWLAGLFAIAFTNLFISSFFEFENDQFAFPLLFASLWFWIAGKKDDSLPFKITAIMLVCFAGLIWHGAIFYLLAFGASWFPALILFVGIALIINPVSFAVLLPNLAIQESSFISGIAAQKFLLAGYAGLKKMFLPEIIVLTLLAFVNLKFAILLLPFLAIGMLHFTLKLFQKAKDFVPGLYSGIGIATYCFVFISVFLAIPTSTDWKAVNTALSYSNNIQNDWDYGYWIGYAGGQPSSWGGGALNNFEKKGIILSQFEQYNCKVLDSFNIRQGSFLEPEKKMFVWEC